MNACRYPTLRPEGWAQVIQAAGNHVPVSPTVVTISIMRDNGEPEGDDRHEMTNDEIWQFLPGPTVLRPLISCRSGTSTGQ
jgi:hypothetical protein